MRIFSRPVVADTALPVIGANASTETLALYRYLRWLKGRPCVIWGVSDRLDIETPLGRMKESRTAFTTQTGRVPALLQVEYHDSNWTTGWTGGWTGGASGTGTPADGPANTAAEISAALTAGVKGIAVNVHMGNPVTGALSRQGQDGGQDGRPGYQYDRSESPVAAILNGGAQYAQFTAWLDRFYDWAMALVYPVGHAHAGARVPIIFRPFHECNGVTFWWAGSDRRSDLKTVWQQMVDYLKAKAPALTNVLFAMHMDSGDATMLQNWDLWYPGNSYVDGLAWSRYDNTTGNDGTSTYARLNDTDGMMDLAYSLAQATAPTKVLMVMETGYTNDDTGNLWDQRVANVATTRYPMLSAYFTWRCAAVGSSTLRWGPGSADSAARKASAAAAVLDPNVITADRCPL